MDKKAVAQPEVHSEKVDSVGHNLVQPLRHNRMHDKERFVGRA